MEFLGLTGAQWTELGIAFGIVVFAALLARLLFTYLLDRLVRTIFKSLGEGLSSKVVKSMGFPLTLGAVLLALYFTLPRLAFLFSEAEQQSLDTAFFIFFFLAAFIFVWRLISSSLDWYGEELAPRTETELDEQVLPFVRRVALIVLTFIGLIILLSRFEVDVSGLVTTLGIGSLAIALAAQASLADAISGFIIMFDRPFRIGDRIEIQDLDTWGDVTDIGLRSTRIRTRDNRMVIVPNSLIGKNLIVNHSYPDTQYRIEIEIGVAYGTDIELARQIMIDAIKDVEGVLPDKPVEALFLQFGDAAMIFRLRWWLESYEDTRRMFDRVNTRVYKALEKAGIEIPYPQLEVRPRLTGELKQYLSEITK